MPAAPPVLIPAAPGSARRGLTPVERTAVTIVGSICALTLSAGVAMHLAGPYLADVARLAYGAAALLGTAAVGWIALRLTGALGRTTGTAAAASSTAPAPVTVHVTGTGGQGGRWGSRGGTGVHIDNLNITR